MLYSKQFFTHLDAEEAENVSAWQPSGMYTSLQTNRAFHLLCLQFGIKQNRIENMWAACVMNTIKPFSVDCCCSLGFGGQSSSESIITIGSAMSVGCLYLGKLFT